MKHENGDASANTFFGSYTYGTTDRLSFKIDAGGVGAAGFYPGITKSPTCCTMRLKTGVKIKHVNSVMAAERRTCLLLCSRCFSISLLPVTAAAQTVVPSSHVHFLSTPGR